MSEAASMLSGWPKVSLARRFLDVYVDYMIFGAAWALAVWGLSKVFPTIETLPFLAKFLTFALAEVLLFKVVKWSPGNDLLGIRLRLCDEYLASRQQSLFSGELVVDPRLKTNEAWWTMLFGVLAILDGAKSAVRWTMFAPPLPLFGIQSSETVSAVVSVAAGVAECSVGAAALQLHRMVFPLSASVYGLAALSAFLSRELWPRWIEASVVARRTFQGVPVRAGEVEMMQSLAPWLAVFPVLLLAWAVAVHSRVRRAAA